MPIKIEKVLSEIKKGTPDEQIEAFRVVKDFVSTTVKEEQEALERQSNNLQNVLDAMNGVR